MSVQSNAPNMRFGSSFLNFTQHNTMHAVNDEVMMDKRTGQLVYKRNTDGKLIYYAQENFHLNNYMQQLKTLMTENKRTYIMPTASNCEYCDSTYFMSYNIEMIDFTPDDRFSDKLIEGGVLKNSYPEPHSFIQETNGFFVQINGRPRDRALLSFMTALYDNYYKNYDGDDPEALALKEYYTIAGYDNSNVVVNYTVTYYDSDDSVVAQDTTDGYARANEISYIPFTYQGIYARSRVTHATLKINSVSTPKLAAAQNLVMTDSQKKLVERITDNDDVAFISCNVSIFICTEDAEFKTPTDDNCIPLLIMGWEEFNEELVRAKVSGGSSGIILDEIEPDPIDWEDITLWMEILRNVATDGTEEETEHATDVDDIENALKDIDYYDGYLTTDKTDTKNFLVELIDE